MRFLAALLTDAVWIVYTYVGMTLLMVYRGAPVEMLITLVAVLLPFVVVHQLCIGAFEGYNFERLRSESDVAFSALLGVITGTGAFFFPVDDGNPLLHAGNAGDWAFRIFDGGCVEPFYLTRLANLVHTPAPSSGRVEFAGVSRRCPGYGGGGRTGFGTLFT